MTFTASNLAANYDLVNIFPRPSAAFTWLIDFDHIKDYDGNFESESFESTECIYSAELYRAINQVEYGDEDNHFNIEGMEGRAIIFLYGRPKLGQYLHVHYRFSMLNMNGDKCNNQEGRQLLPAYPIAQLSVDLKDLHSKNVSRNGIVKFNIEIFELHSENVAAGLNKDNLIGLSQDQHALLVNGNFSDAVLTVGRKEFKVHKAILATRSSIFESIFECTKEDPVVITDLAADVLQELLRFLYTGHVFEMELFAEELLIAADKYKVKTLKFYCEKYISSTLTTETVDHSLQLAKLYGATHLQKRCIKFQEANPAKRFLKRKVLK